MRAYAWWTLEESPEIGGKIEVGEKIARQGA
jgi:hypothetical protein